MVNWYKRVPFPCVWTWSGTKCQTLSSFVTLVQLLVTAAKCKQNNVPGCGIPVEGMRVRQYHTSTLQNPTVVFLVVLVGS